MSTLPVDKNNKGMQAIMVGTSQTVSISASSVQSSAFQTGVRVIRLFPETDCYIAIGSNPTATTSSCYLPAGIIQFFGVQEGQKLAVLRKTTSGTLYLLEGGV